MQNSLNKQKGMTAIGWIILLSILGFNGLVAINIAPVYFTDSSVTSIWKNLETDAAVVGKSPKDLRAMIVKRLKINNVYDIHKDDISIRKSGDKYIVELWYEPRGKIMGSLDYIITFEHVAEVRAK